MAETQEELVNQIEIIETVVKLNTLEVMPETPKEIENRNEPIETVKSNKHVIKSKTTKLNTRKGSSRIKIKRTARSNVRKSIKSRISLRNRYKHTTKLNKCNMCEKEYIYKRSLFFHMMTIHPPEKSFKCTECSESFFGLFSLKQHIETHSTEKKDPNEQWKNELIPCETCGKSYTLDNSSICHSSSKHHMREKSYKCTKCDEAFYYLVHLRIHLGLHQKGRILEPTTIDGEQTNPPASQRPIEADLLAFKRFKYTKSENECNLCEEIFDCPIAVDNHKKLCHNSKLKFSFLK